MRRWRLRSASRAWCWSSRSSCPPSLLARLAAGGQDASARLPLVQGALQRRDHSPGPAPRPSPICGPSRFFSRFSDAALWDYVAAGTIPVEPGDRGDRGDRGPPATQAPGVTLTCPREWEARIYATPPLDVWEVLAGLTVPTLGLRGADTDTLLPEAWALWQGLQPRARFGELPGLGHLLRWRTAPR